MSNINSRANIKASARQTTMLFQVFLTWENLVNICTVVDKHNRNGMRRIQLQNISINSAWSSFALPLTHKICKLINKHLAIRHMTWLYKSHRWMTQSRCRSLCWQNVWNFVEMAAVKWDRSLSYDIISIKKPSIIDARSCNGNWGRSWYDDAHNYLFEDFFTLLNALLAHYKSNLS